jgi:hypothetical protein
MTFKVEAGKRYIRRDGSVMGKPLETSTHADLRSKYPFFDPGIPTHIKTNGVALAGSNGQFDLVSFTRNLISRSHCVSVTKSITTRV